MSWLANPLFAAAAAKGDYTYLWYSLLAALAVIAVSVFLGNYLGRMLRMPDHGWKISLCLFSLLASAAVLWMGPPFKKGIDLSGGVILVYEVDQTQKKTNEAVDMDKLIAAVKRRVDPGGQKEVTIRTYGVEQVEIIIPEIDENEVKRIKGIISTTGELQFRILANNRYNKDIIAQAEAEPSKIQIRDAEGKLLAWWVPVRSTELRSVAGYPEIARRTRQTPDGEITEVLVLKDEYDVTGAYLTQARAGTFEGKPCVHFSFNDYGGQLFGSMTGTHLPDKTGDFTFKLAIILDNEIYSAPSIQAAITTQGQITGSFTPQEVSSLVSVLNAGSLPAALAKQPVSELFSGPTLGRDTIEKSTNAMLIAVILVPAFMLVYYRFSGLVADIALILNMLILLAVMVSIKAAFTLTGFAGLALTVGMAVDNNVLVYERLREELARGAGLRMAIRNAFQRASATIIDSNLTTLIAATVLYVIGTDQLKGFAVPLWIGVAVSIFTSVFVARVIFDIAEKRRWITEVRMMRIIGNTNIAFMRWFPAALTASLVFIVGGLGVSFLRGQGLFDIDFTGGISVQAQFNQPQKTGDVRELLKDRLPDLAVSDVQFGREERGLRFLINTSEPDMTKVKHVLSQMFGNKLVRNAMEFSEPKAIAEAQPAPEAEKKPATRDAFAGGSQAELTFKLPLSHSAAEELLKEALAAKPLDDAAVPFQLTCPGYVEGSRTPATTWTLKILMPPDRAQTFLADMKQEIAESPLFPASSTIGSAVAGHTRWLAVNALVASWFCMIVYLWIRFQGVAFGLAAVLALVHDVFVMLGAVAISYYVADYLGFLLIEPFKINLPILAAFLTIIGFSVNDTIVIFDRIREVRGKNPNMTKQMVNDSVNQTLSRTLLTSLTVLLVAGSLYVFGGEAIHGFAFALLVGVVTGTYSTIYIASPLLLWMYSKREKAAA